MYNKTTLKKIKKDELVQMYLDLQAKNYDEKMEEVLDKCCTNAINETVEELKKENESLKEELGEMTGSAEDNEYDLNSLRDDLKNLDDFTEEENITEYDDVVPFIQDLKKEIKKLKKENESLKEERDEQMEKNEDLRWWVKKILSKMAAAAYRKQKGKEDPIKDVMNDIINQVEEKEWKSVKSHNERLIRFHHRDTKKLKNMKEDWEVATGKIGQENSELHNEIKGLRAKLR